MNWAWAESGFRNSYPDLADKLQALFQEHLPEGVIGAVRVVKVSREPGYATMVALATSVGDANEAILLPPETISRIRKEYGRETLHVVRWSDDAESLIRNALCKA